MAFNSMRAVARPGVYPGWAVVAAAFVNTALVIGATNYLFGLVVAPAGRDLGLSRADANNGLAAFMIGYAVFSPAAGWLVDRVSARAIMPLGGLLMLAALLVIANAASPLLIAAMMAGPLALGAGLAGATACSAVVSRWFRRRRGRAMGVLAMASSAAGFALGPCAALLIDRFGWRGALTIIGLVLGGLVCALGLLVIRDRPNEDQLQAAGELQAPEGAVLPSAAGPDDRIWTVGDLLRCRNFHLIMFGVGLLLASDQALLASTVPFLQDNGVGLKAASLLVSCQSASALCGKYLVGHLADRFDIRRLFALVVVCHIILLGLYLVWPGYWIVFAALSVIGVAIGGVYPVKMLLTAATFGSRSFGLAFGAMQLPSQLLAIVALRGMGEAYDRTGSYAWGFAGLMAAALISLILISLVGAARPERRWRPAQAQQG
jgi:MFS family permease